MALWEEMELQPLTDQIFEGDARLVGMQGSPSRARQRDLTLQPFYQISTKGTSRIPSIASAKAPYRGGAMIVSPLRVHSGEASSR